MTSHDVAAALLAMPPFPMARVPAPPKKPVAGTLDANTGQPQNCPTKPFSKRIADLFRRKHTTPWSDKEIAAYRKLTIYPDEATMHAEMDMMAAYYKAERAKGEKGIQRRDLATFLNNFHSELDRARAHAEAKRRRAAQYAPPKPDNVIPIRDEAEEERLRQQAAAQLSQFKKAL